MRESERLRREADDLEKSEGSYAETLQTVRQGAMLLEVMEPTMRALIRSYEHALGVGAVLNPSMFMRVHGDKNVELQVRLAKAVCVFVKEFQAIRQIGLEELHQNEGKGGGP